MKLLLALGAGLLAFFFRAFVGDGFRRHLVERPDMFTSSFTRHSCSIARLR
jgi:hypothetical protein